MTRLQITIGIGAVLMLAGFSILNVSYTVTTLGISGSKDTSIPIRCVAPIRDAFKKESSGWLNYDPKRSDQNRGEFSGSWCRPQSLVRAAIGAGAVVIGGVMVLVALGRRRRSKADDEPSTDGAPDGWPPAGPSDGINRALL